MAHKKGQGSVKNGRDSLAKRRGIKKYDGESVTAGSIIVLQCGTKWHPGKNVKRARNDSLFALSDGVVKFFSGGRKVGVYTREEYTALVAANKQPAAATA